jgi:molybdate transport system substrate-binding protein
MGREPVPLWRNELVVVVPASGPSCDGCAVTGPADLASLPCVALPAPETSPAGRYARDALRALGLWDGVRPQATGAADVRAALGQVATGACPAGIVYRTDAASTDAVRVALHLEPPSPVTYYAVPLEDRGADFLAFLAGPEGRRLAREAGLQPVEDAP